MPLFMVKKEVYEWIEKKLRTVDIRKGKAKRGSMAVFVCGKGKDKVVRARIIKRMEGDLISLLEHFGFRNVIPTAETIQEAMTYIKKLYGATEGTFTAYEFSVKNDA